MRRVCGSGSARSRRMGRSLDSRHRRLGEQGTRARSERMPTTAEPPEREMTGESYWRVDGLVLAEGEGDDGLAECQVSRNEVEREFDLDRASGSGDLIRCSMYNHHWSLCGVPLCS